MDSVILSITTTIILTITAPLMPPAPSAQSLCRKQASRIVLSDSLFEAASSRLLHRMRFGEEYRQLRERGDAICSDISKLTDPDKTL